MKKRERKAGLWDTRLVMFCVAGLLCLLIFIVGRGQETKQTGQTVDATASPTPEKKLLSQAEFLDKLKEEVKLNDIGGGRYALPRGEYLSDAEMILSVNMEGVYGFSILAENPNEPGTLSENPGKYEKALYEWRTQLWERNLSWLEATLHSCMEALYACDSISYGDVDLLYYYATQAIASEKIQKTEEGCLFRAYVNKGVLHISVEYTGK